MRLLPLKFPHASCPAPLDATRAFDDASRQLLEDVVALQRTLEQELAKEAGFDAVRQRAAAAPPAPARGVSGIRARGGGAGGRGRGVRGGRRGGLIAAAAAASTSTSTSTSPEPGAAGSAAASPAPARDSSGDEAVLLFHQQRMQELRQAEARARVAPMLQRIDDEVEAEFAALPAVQ